MTVKYLILNTIKPINIIYKVKYVYILAVFVVLPLIHVNIIVKNIFLHSNENIVWITIENNDNYKCKVHQNLDVLQYAVARVWLCSC